MTVYTFKKEKRAAILNEGESETKDKNRHTCSGKKKSDFIHFIAPPPA